VFGWPGALYAMITIFVDGTTSDYVLEGPSRIRTATIITNQPDAVAAVLMHQLGRGVTAWQGQGMYTHQERSILFVTVSRPQVSDLRRMVFSVDPDAFIVIGQGHTAYGEGFQMPGP
ncbi:MAG: YitT family protein, partial [Anaerolineae bacterium]|nr:YitT family protein [Anaerolineae bacterium]